MRRTTLVRAGAAAVGMVLIAEAGTWLLRPRPAPISPAPVSASDYFTQTEIDRGRDYDNGQLWLYVGGLAIEMVVLVGVASGRPRIVRAALARAGERPVLGAAAVGAGLSVAVAVASLPVGIAAHERAVDFGISTQDLGSWLGDAAKQAAIGAVIAAPIAAGFAALVRRLPRVWWIPGSVLAVGIAAVMTWLAPVVLAPLFNRFEALPKGSPARAQVLELAKRAGVDVGNVYRVDASRRVRSLNAYVDGIGSTKRVVLYDNLIKGTDRAQLSSVVAHELGHVKHDDILRGLAFVALAAPLGLLFARSVGEPLSRRTGFAPGSPGSIPAYALGLALASLAIGIVGNQLSRQVEASADSFALDETHAPKPFIQLQRKLALSSVSDPDPPAIPQFLLGSHPTTVQRIGEALAWENGAR
jgi:Zn-dependent protease with chaperone function